MSKRIFSTGKIRYGAVGVTLDDTNNVADVQNVTFDAKFSEALVRQAKQLGQFPLEGVRYDGEITIDFETMSQEPGLYQYVYGTTHASSGGYDTYTFGDTAEPQPMQLVFIGQSTDDKTYEIDLPIGIAKELSLAAKRDGFMGTKISVAYRPNPTLTTNKPVIKMQQ